MTEVEITTALKSLEGWSLAQSGKAIFKSFQFKTFSKAWGFMSQAALVAEKIDHHPEWFNVYGRVDVTFTTHSAGGVTDLDIQLATAMNKIAG